MARPIIVANWKMNLLGQQATSLARCVAHSPACKEDVLVLLAPPHPYLERVQAILRSTPVGLAAQDLHPEESGAFTGSVSGAMIADTGATHVLVGHSERRRDCGEDDAMVRRKIVAALRARLTPVVCVGESLRQRDSGRAGRVVREQIHAALQAPGWLQTGELWVAYEPVWAIGTGRVAQPDQVSAIHAILRELLGARARILYGGSVGPHNAGDLLQQPDVDGLLVGSAALAAERFLEVIQQAAAGAGSS
ncbi:MAG: triose-phosphate isomerase [Acidobacteriota bacterium]